MTQPYRNARKTRAILHRSRDPRRERRPRHNPATKAAARMAAMLRHFQGTRLGKVEYLACDRRSHISRSRQRRTAAPAYLRNVLLHPVRARRPAQRPALVARLSPRLAPRPASKALRAALRRRLLQPVARRRLAAVGAGQTETALQLPYPVPKPRVLQLKTRNLLTGALGPRHSQRVKRFGTTHPKVDSFFDSTVNPSWAVTKLPEIGPGKNPCRLFKFSQTGATLEELRKQAPDAALKGLAQPLSEPRDAQ